MESSALKYIYNEGFYNIPEALIEKTTPPPVREELKQSVIAHLGKNKKHICILNGCETINIISQKNQDFLIKILNAVQLNIEDVVITTWDNNYDINQLKKKFNYKVLLGIDIPFGKLELEIVKEMYNIYDLDGVRYLWTDSLEKIEGDVEKKKLLWKNLKILFN